MASPLTDTNTGKIHATTVGPHHCALVSTSASHLHNVTTAYTPNIRTIVHNGGLDTNRLIHHSTLAKTSSTPMGLSSRTLLVD